MLLAVEDLTTRVWFLINYFLYTSNNFSELKRIRYTKNYGELIEVIKDIGSSEALYIQLI